MKTPEQYRRTTKGTIQLAKYALHGDKIVTDPDIQSMIKQYRQLSRTQQSDEEILALIMDTLARCTHGSMPS